MPLTRERKRELVEGMHSLANESSTLLLADYRGLDVAAMTDMRRRARQQDIQLRVVPNRLVRRALEGTQHDCLATSLKGPNMLASTREDAGTLARLMREFLREHDELSIRAISIDGHLVPGDQLRTIANMPTREQALSMLMGTLTAPITKLAQVLNAVPQKLVGTLDAVAKERSKET